jgi:hypothetical protein
MATNSSEIYDLFLSRVNDYRLVSIFQSSGSMVLGSYLEPWILDSISEFSPVCTQSLAFTTTSGSVEGFFTETLTTEHMLILSRILVKYWMNKSVNDVLQFSNSLQDSDFKTFSQAQNLKSKQDYLNNIKEEISQILIDYGYKNNDWLNWRNQNFDL